MSKIRIDNNNRKNGKQYNKIQSNSSIGEHLGDIQNYFKNYDWNEFKIISKGRNQFHMKTLEVTYILSKNPELCKQKKFVF